MKIVIFLPQVCGEALDCYQS